MTERQLKAEAFMNRARVAYNAITDETGIEKWLDEELAVMEMVCHVEDHTMAVILIQRYLLWKPWEEIASFIGYTPKRCIEKRRSALDAVADILEASA